MFTVSEYRYCWYKIMNNSTIFQLFCLYGNEKESMEVTVEVIVEVYMEITAKKTVEYLLSYNIV